MTRKVLTREELQWKDEKQKCRGFRFDYIGESTRVRVAARRVERLAIILIASIKANEPRDNSVETLHDTS